MQVSGNLYVLYWFAVKRRFIVKRKAEVESSGSTLTAERQTSG